MNAPLVIVGTGAAGYALLRALRQINGDRPLVLITRDDGAAYEKFRLARALGTRTRARDLVLATVEQMAHRYGATILAHRHILRIDRLRHELVMREGRYGYGQLVLATGAAPLRQPGLRGTAASQALTLGSLADYAYLRSELAGRSRVVVLGGSLAGCELADNLARSGCHVTLLEPANQLLAETLPTLSAERVAQALQAAGVQVMTEDGIQRIDQGPDELELTTLAGVRFSTDLVVLARGAVPRTELARDAGLAVTRGVVVDHALGTADPDIFALGECAEIDGRLFRLPEDIEAGAQVLAEVLCGRKRRMRWQARLRRLQMESCPVTVCEPPPLAGEWHEAATQRGVRAVFRDRRGALRGFALLGDQVAAAERLLGELGR